MIRSFTKVNVQVADEHTERCSESLLTRVTQTKTAARHRSLTRQRERTKADETTLTPGRLSLGNVPAVCSLRCVPGAGGSCLRKARAGKPATAAVMTSWNWDVSRCPPQEDGRAAASPCGREAPCGSKRTSARRASASRASCGADARSEGGEIDAGR